MRYSPKEFDVVVLIDLEADGTQTLPHPEDRVTMYNLFGNGGYENFACPDDSDVVYVIAAEQEWFAQIRGGQEWEAEYDDVCESIAGCFDFPGIDFGVAGAVYALNAAGFITGTCCNGGAFGHDHHEDHALVALVGVDALLPDLMATAKEIGVGLKRQDGTILLYSDEIDKMIAFGPALLRRTKPQLKFEAKAPEFVSGASTVGL